MISCAEGRKREQGIKNIGFVCEDIRGLDIDIYDFATSTLCLHEVGVEVACEILELMICKSNKVLIADYTSPDTFFGQYRDR